MVAIKIVKLCHSSEMAVYPGYLDYSRSKHHPNAVLVLQLWIIFPAFFRVSFEYNKLDFFETQYSIAFQEARLTWLDIWQHFSSFLYITTIFKKLKSSTMNSGKLLTGVLIGAAAGAILGVLFAPDKGSETRGKISKKSSDLKNNVKDKINDLVDGISSHYENVKSEAEDAFADGKEKYGKAKAEVKNSFS